MKYARTPLHKSSRLYEFSITNLPFWEIQFSDLFKDLYKEDLQVEIFASYSLEIGLPLRTVILPKRAGLAKSRP